MSSLGIIQVINTLTVTMLLVLPKHDCYQLVKVTVNE
jgi:hypothetical protein